MLITGFIATAITAAQLLTAGQILTVLGTTCIAAAPAVEAIREKNNRRRIEQEEEEDED